MKRSKSSKPRRKGDGRTGIPVAAVIGHPVAHSLSPAIFSFLSKSSGKPVAYQKLDLSPEELSSSLNFFKTHPLFVGLNVTIPHKKAVLASCSSLSEEARALGAVNVLEFRDGSLFGHNTDTIGVTETLREQGCRIRGSSAVIFGAGGAALAAGFALGKLGVARVTFVNRTRERAQAAALKLGAAFRNVSFVASTPDEAPDALEQAILHINATPLGMKGFPEEILMPLPETVRPKALAFDLVYRPERTVFLEEAGKRGLRTVGGLDMLIWQAIATWELWFGRLPGRAKLKTALKRHLKDSFF